MTADHPTEKQLRAMADWAMAKFNAVRAADPATSPTRPTDNALDLGAFDPKSPGAFGWLSKMTESSLSPGGRTLPEPVEGPSTGSGNGPSTGSGNVEAGSGNGPSTGSGNGPSTGSGNVEAGSGNGTGDAATIPEPVEGPPATTEPEAPPEKTLEELLAELDGLTGLTEVKAEIHRQVAVLRVEGLRTKAGLKAPTITRHLVFVGNPGTGKTTVARLVGGIYRALGLLSQGQLVEVDRSELVAGFLGQTAMKTAEVVASAAGGVLFIDEAYSLAGDQYGQESVDTLVKEMEDRRDDLVLIVAGYPDPMARFIAQNPGLASRFRTTIEFADYADEELVDIFSGLAQAADYDVTDDTLRRFTAILTTTPRGPMFGNGRFARNLLEEAIGHHAWRLRDTAEPTLAELRELQPDDLDPTTVVTPAPLDPLPEAVVPEGPRDPGTDPEPEAPSEPEATP